MSDKDLKTHHAINRRINAGEPVFLQQNGAAPAQQPLQPSAQQIPQIVSSVRTRSAVPEALPADYVPTEETVRRLTMLNIPVEYIEAQLSEFVLYWNGRGDTHRNWDHRFFQWVQNQFRKALMQAPTEPMTGAFRPSRETLEHLYNYCAIHPDFAMQHLPDFIQYWAERGDVCNTWQSRFINHVKICYERESRRRQQAGPAPTPMTDDFQPSPAVLRLLTESCEIPEDFAMAQVPEFIFYWQEKGELQSTWQSKFKNHVIYQWRRQQSEGSEQAGRAAAPKAATTEELTDTSWGDKFQFRFEDDA
ncbi:DnaT-like ssDNA-binding domain-containing protein [Endozoicomonadaceae bacterium StTr2]